MKAKLIGRTSVRDNIKLSGDPAYPVFRELYGKQKKASLKGAQRYYLQRYHPGEEQNSSPKYSSYSKEEMDDFVRQSDGEVVLSVRE